jgi:hypothetical protein
MLRLVLLGTLGYLGYKFLGNDRAEKSKARASAVAGGPLSDKAMLVHNPGQPTAADRLVSQTPAANSA